MKLIHVFFLLTQKTRPDSEGEKKMVILGKERSELQEITNWTKAVIIVSWV